MDFTPEEVAHNQSLLDQQEALFQQTKLQQPPSPGNANKLPLDARDFLSDSRPPESVASDQAPINVSDFVSQTETMVPTQPASPSQPKPESPLQASGIAAGDAEIPVPPVAPTATSSDDPSNDNSTDRAPSIDGIDLAALSAGLEAARAFDQTKQQATNEPQSTVAETPSQQFTQPAVGEHQSDEEKIFSPIAANLTQQPSSEPIQPTVEITGPTPSMNELAGEAETTFVDESAQAESAPQVNQPVSEAIKPPHQEDGLASELLSDQQKTFASPDDDEQETSSESPSTPQTLEPVVDNQPGQFDDPFAESFEQEETLRDRFAPIIAAQNQSSTELVSSDLAFVQPLDVSAPETSNANDSQPESAAAIQPPPTQEQPNVTQSDEIRQRPEEPQVEDIPTMAGAPTTPENASTIQQTPAAVETEETPVQEAASTTESSQFGAFNPIDFTRLEASSEPSQPTEQISVPLEPKIEQPPEPTQAGATAVIRPSHSVPPSIVPEETTSLEQQLATRASEVSVPEPQEHRHITEAANDEISRQAEAILQRLKASQSVSHETQVNTNSPEDASSAELTSSETKLDDPTEEILNQIRQQSEMIQQSQSLQTPAEPGPTLTLQQNHDDQATTTEPSAHQDDSEMIVVSRNEEHQPAPPKETPIDLPKPPVSSGRAQRMDYQKLFDQLRNVDSHESTEQ